MKRPDLNVIVEGIITTATIGGYLFDLFTISTVIITVISLIFFLFLFYDKIWLYDNLEDNNSLKILMTKTKTILLILFLFIPLFFCSLNLARKYLPNEVNKYVAYHYSLPTEYQKIQNEKITESKFVGLSLDTNQVKIYKVDFNHPKVIIKKEENSYFLISPKFISEDYIFNITKFGNKLFFWSLLPFCVILLFMQLADKVSQYMK